MADGTTHAPRVVVTDAPDMVAVELISAGLGEFNTARTGVDDHRPLTVLVTDPETKRSSVA
ncbi:MAG TPA: hypothetical protein VGL06_08975 [Pseudonocardiaceae bacterium]